MRLHKQKIYSSFLLLLFLCTLLLLMNIALFLPNVSASEAEMTLESSLQNNVRTFRIKNFDYTQYLKRTSQKSNKSNFPNIYIDDEYLHKARDIFLSYEYGAVDEEGNVTVLSEEEGYRFEQYDDNVADDTGKRKNYFKSELYVIYTPLLGEHAYLCAGRMTWLQEPNTRSRDCFAFNWSDGAYYDDSQSGYEYGSFSYVKHPGGSLPGATPQEISETPDISYSSGKIQFNFNLPTDGPSSGLLSQLTFTDFEIYGHLILYSPTGVFNFSVGYGHKFFALSPSISVSYSGSIGISFSPSAYIRGYYPAPILVR